MIIHWFRRHQETSGPLCEAWAKMSDRQFEPAYDGCLHDSCWAASGDMAMTKANKWFLTHGHHPCSD